MTLECEMTLEWVFVSIGALTFSVFYAFHKAIYRKPRYYAEELNRLISRVHEQEAEIEALKEKLYWANSDVGKPLVYIPDDPPVSVTYDYRRPLAPKVPKPS